MYGVLVGVMVGFWAGSMGLVHFFPFSFLMILIINISGMSKVMQQAAVTIHQGTSVSATEQEEQSGKYSNK